MIRKAWRNAYRAARLGYEVAIHFGSKRRDSNGRYGFIIRPGGHTNWGHMGTSCGTAGQNVAEIMREAERYSLFTRSERGLRRNIMRILVTYAGRLP